MRIAIDPGVKVMGWACLDRGELTACGVVCSGIKDYRDMAARLVSRIGLPDVVVLEGMEIRRSDTSKRAADILAVQTAGLRLAVELTGLGVKSLSLINVSSWKAPIPKAIHHPRILNNLSLSEMMIVSDALNTIPKRNHKEVFDAIGLALFSAGITKKDGTKCRT